MTTITPDQSVMGILNSKNIPLIERNTRKLKYVDEILDRLRDTREYSQETALQAMLLNEEAAPSIIKSIDRLNTSMGKGFKELANEMANMTGTFGSVGLMGDGIIDAEFVKLSEEDVSTLTDTYQRASDEMTVALATELYEIKGILKKSHTDVVESNTDSSMMSMKTDLELIRLGSDTMLYYLKDATNYLEQIAQGTAVGKKKNDDGKGDGIADDDKAKKDGSWLNELFDDALGFLGLSTLFSKIKAGLQKYTKGLDWIFNKSKGAITKVWGAVSKGAVDLFKYINNLAPVKFIKNVVGKLSEKIVSMVTKPFKLLGDFIAPYLARFSEFTLKLVARLKSLTPGPILKAFEGIGSMFGKIFGGVTKLGGMLGKISGFIGKGLLKITKIGFGKLFAIVMAVFDFFGGLRNMEEISGKAKEKLSIVEKFLTGIAGIVDGLTLGIIDAKTVYKWTNFFTDAVKDAMVSAWSILPKGMRDRMAEIYGFFMDKKTGLFGSIPTLLNRVLDDIGGGKWILALKDLLLLIPRAIGDLLIRLKNVLGEYLGNIGSSMMKAMEGTSVGKYLIDGAKSIYEGIMGMIKTMVGALLPASAMRAMSSVSQFWDKAKNLASNALTSEGLEESSTKSVAVSKPSASKVVPVQKAKSYGEGSQAIARTKKKEDEMRQAPTVISSPNIIVPPPVQGQSGYASKTGANDMGLSLVNLGS